MQRHVKIVLPCTNEREWLRATVDSILEHTRAYPSFEVAVLANGDTETDFSFADGEPYRGLVRISKNPAPLGVGRSINAALSPGDATFYVFLDAHCLLEQDDWLERGIRCLEEHPTCSMVQPEVVEFIYHGDLVPGVVAPDPALIERVGF
ncbi:MAG TPA: glycosyltransferase family A protein, partial [Gemmatimonadales bacterium]|nr:glycosyltransferase family A protein [Gemmatimonadales bacterium]